MTKHDKKSDKIDEEELKETEEHVEEAVEALETVGQDDEFSARLEEAENKFRRALADYQNLEKRVIEDRREWIRQANKDLLLRILPVLDTLMLAGKHTEDKNLHISIQQFFDILKSEGVTEIETVGKKFNPETMEAVGTSEGKDGEVVEEARAGFLLYDKLLRPAQVIVGSKN